MPDGDLSWWMRSAFNVGVVMPCGVACVLCCLPFQFIFRLVTGSYDHEEPPPPPPAAAAPTTPTTTATTTPSDIDGADCDLPGPTKECDD